MTGTVKSFKMFLKLRRYLYRAQTPTLIMWGEQDGYAPLTHSQAYRQGIVNSSLAIIVMLLCVSGREDGIDAISE